MPLARIDSSAARASSRDDDNSISTYQGCLLVKRIADVDAVTNAEIDRDVGQQFEAGQAAGRLVLRDRQQLERLRGRFQADIGGLDRARLRKQFQRRCGDDAERALGADEEVAQIVAGIVLFQLRQPFRMRPSASTTSSPSAISRATP